MPDESVTLAETPTPSYRALGVSGLIHYGTGAHGDGRVYEEWLKALRGVEGARVYREMQDNDPIIGAILFSTEMLLRQVDWSVEPASDKQEDKDNATFVEECLHDMRQTWEDTLSEIMSMLPFGWAFLETVFKKRTATNSKYDDGKVGWAIWGIRGQDTLDHWEFDENNEANALVQLSPPDYTFHTIPLAKGMLFRTTSRKSNPQGRALSPYTPIPTPHGWRLLDQLQPGDSVFDEMGKVRYITARQDWEDRPCYHVSFNDGSSIVADANHQWVTSRKHERYQGESGRIRTTEEIFATVKDNQGVSNHSIEWAKPLDYTEQHLPVDPYVFGLWLGDGYRNACAIACHVADADETVANIEAAGYAARVTDNGVNSLGRSIRIYGNGKWDASGPSAAFRAMGVFSPDDNKHIPEAYLRGSITQRRALLAGLMDSDGFVNGDGCCEFSNTNLQLIYGVTELVRSLGCGARARLHTHANGTTHKKDGWGVYFTPDWSPFRLARKSAKIINGHARRRHYIVDVQPASSQRTVCIEVDSPSHLFLAGTGMVPTHNSVLRNAFVSWYRKKHIEAMEAIGVERDLSGLPMLKIPAEVIIANGTDYVNYQTLARNIRNDEQASIILPSDRDMHGQPYYSFELISSPGKRPFDTDAIITRYDQRILMTVMADFIMVGHERVGSNAMVRSKSKLFTAAIQSYLDSIAAVVNETGIPQLLRYNGITTATPPRLMHGNVERADMDVLGTFLFNMAQAMSLGGQALNLQPGSDLYNFIMDQAGLPKSGPLAVGVDPSPSAVPAPAAPTTPGQAPKPATPPVRPEPAATPLKKQRPTGRDQADHPTLTEE